MSTTEHVIMRARYKTTSWNLGMLGVLIMTEDEIAFAPDDPMPSIELAEGFKKIKSHQYSKEGSRLALLKLTHEEWRLHLSVLQLDPLNVMFAEILLVSGVLSDKSQVKGIVDETKQVITNISTRKRAERPKAEDFDAEEWELLEAVNEQEEEVFDQVGRMRTLINKFMASF